MFPKLFQIGQFALPTYGLLVAVAFLVALWMAPGDCHTAFIQLRCKAGAGRQGIGGWPVPPPR